MIVEISTPRQATSQQAARELDEAGEILYESIPTRVGHVAHPEYFCPVTENDLFGPEAPTISVPRWGAYPAIEDGQEDVELRQARVTLSRQDETILFKRYNCARFHLAGLMKKQERRFARDRVSEILMWYRRILESRVALIEANMALVMTMARRSRVNTVDLGELVSEGNMALLRAVDKFDFSQGFKFSTYACCAMLRAFSRLAGKAGLHRQRFPTSFEPEMERSDESERRYADQRKLDLDDLSRVLKLNRAGLTEMEQTVLKARFALAGQDRVQTLQEVGRFVQLSSEGVRNIQKRALAKLRLALEPTSWA